MRLSTYMTNGKDMQVSSKSNTSHLLTCFPVFVIISFGNPTYKKSLSIVKDFNVTPKLFCLLQDNICNNLLYKYDLSRKTVTIRYVPKNKGGVCLGCEITFVQGKREEVAGGKKREEKKKREKWRRGPLVLSSFSPFSFNPSTLPPLDPPNMEQHRLPKSLSFSGTKTSQNTQGLH